MDELEWLTTQAVNRGVHLAAECVQQLKNDIEHGTLKRWHGDAAATCDLIVKLLVRLADEHQAMADKEHSVVM